jgi:hypothetical protein
MSAAPTLPSALPLFGRANSPFSGRSLPFACHGGASKSTGRTLMPDAAIRSMYRSVAPKLYLPREVSMSSHLNCCRWMLMPAALWPARSPSASAGLFSIAEA